MEHVSLKSSTHHGYTLNLRSTDQSLHDATQRFVESLSKDIRISQFADMNLVKKVLVNDKWYVLQPIHGARVGYLVCLPNQPVVWMDEQFKRSYRIPMRISIPIYEKKSVFITSLNKVDGVLRFEDAWMIAGDFLRGRPFSARWEALCSFYNFKYRFDSVLQQGFRIEMCEYQPLSSLLENTSLPPMLFVQGERGQRRLRVQLQTQTQSQPPLPPPLPPKAPLLPTPKVAERVYLTGSPHKPSTTSLSNAAPAFLIEIDDRLDSDSVAKAIPHEEYPDTYDLWIRGEKKGYAAVQDISLSRKLKAASGKEKKEVLVNVEWNSEFNMFEIVSLV